MVVAWFAFSQPWYDTAPLSSFDSSRNTSMSPREHVSFAWTEGRRREISFSARLLCVRSETPFLSHTGGGEGSG